MTRRFADRIAGAILLALAVWYGLTASEFQVAFGDPVGPSAFPRMLAVPLALFSLSLLLRPDPDAAWFRWPATARQAGALAILLAYPALIEPLGFPISTAFGSALLARILGATWLQSTTLGVALGIGLFALFDQLLGLPLPFRPEITG